MQQLLGCNLKRRLYCTVDWKAVTEVMGESCIVIREIQSDTKKRELLKNPTKIEEIQEKIFIDRN